MKTNFLVFLRSIRFHRHPLTHSHHVIYVICHHRHMTNKYIMADLCHMKEMTDDIYNQAMPSWARRQGCYNVTATKLGWLQLDFFLMKKMKNTEARYCHSPIQPNTYCCSYFGYLLLKTTTMILVQVKSLTSPYCFGSYCTPQSWLPLEAHTALVCSLLPKVDFLLKVHRWSE